MLNKDFLVADVTVRFRMEDICSEEDLKAQGGMSLMDMIKMLIEEDGLSSWVDNEDLEVIVVERRSEADPSEAEHSATERS